MNGFEDLEMLASWIAKAGIGVYIVLLARKIVFKEDVEKVEEDIDEKLNEKLDRREYEARMNSLDSDIKDIKEAQVRSEEHNRADFRELRDLIQRQSDREKE